MLNLLRNILTLILLSSSLLCCNSVAPKKETKQAKAGQVNELIILNNYDDLAPMFTEELKIVITKPLFESVDSITKSQVGDFVKAIDTTSATINGITMFTVRNQYQKGTTTTTIQLNEQDKIVHLFTVPKKN